MKIYLAARFVREAEMREAAAYLRARGHEITSRWIDGSHELEQFPTEAERTRLALEGWHDLSRADILIAFSEVPRTPDISRGGRHVEFGLALARSKLVYVVGPKENVFHYLPVVRHFAGLSEAIKAAEDDDSFAI